MNGEVAMAALMNNASSRFFQWFKQFREKNRRPTAGMSVTSAWDD
jgi:hypothetical protein